MKDHASRPIPGFPGYTITMKLVVLPMREVCSGADAFHCPVYHCDLAAADCTWRQREARKTSPSEARARDASERVRHRAPLALSSCRACAYGVSIADQIGEVLKPAL